MLVEFIGAAGAGKSFLSDGLLDQLRARGIAAGNFDLIEIDRASITNIFLTAKAVYLSMRTRQKTMARFVHCFAIIARFGVRRRLCEQIGGIQITSEGLFHRIITMSRNSKSEGMDQLATMLYRNIQPPDLVVVVEVSAETAFRRRSARDRENDVFTRDSVRADVEIISESVEVMALIKQTLHPALEILRVDAEEDGGHAVIEQIIATLVRYDRGLSETLR